MNKIEEITNKQLNPNVPEFRVGDTVRVGVRIIEGKKERVQAFEGVVISRKVMVYLKHLQYVRCLVVLELKEYSQFIHQNLILLK